MKDFTDLVNAGQQSYVDKYTKKRNFGNCFGCEDYNLLIVYYNDDIEDELEICEKCYNKVLFGEI